MNMLFYVVINLLLALTVICLNTFFFYVSYVELLYVSGEFYSFTCYVDDMVQSKFPLRVHTHVPYANTFTQTHRT